MDNELKLLLKPILIEAVKQKIAYGNISEDLIKKVDELIIQNRDRKINELLNGNNS